LSFPARKAKLFFGIKRPSAEPASVAVQDLDLSSAIIAEGQRPLGPQFQATMTEKAVMGEKA
jgi:hypothetical protein